MKTIKIFFAALAVITLSSCAFDINLGQENGNGNVVTEERNVSDFNKVKGSAGLDVYITKGSENKVVVEADENLMEFIKTEVRDGRLTIGTERSIGRSKAKKVHVTFVELSGIAASSGSDVIVNSVVKNENITLEASSGADLEVEVFAKDLYVKTSSGAEIKVSGKATKLKAKSSSGSDIDAEELSVINCDADASSGGDITVNVKGDLETEATSGGTIRYYGNPSAVSKNGSRTGNIHKM